jgi:hypothetical protein
VPFLVAEMRNCANGGIDYPSWFAARKEQLLVVSVVLFIGRWSYWEHCFLFMPLFWQK